MLVYLYVNNYKSLVNFELDLRDDNQNNIKVLIGKNGCGKTSVFEVVAGLRNLITGTDHRSCGDIFSARTVTRWQNNMIQTFELGIVEKGTSYRYHLEIEHSDKSDKIKKEYVKKDDNYIFEAEYGQAKLYNDRLEQGTEILTDWQYSGVSVVHARPDNTILTEFKIAIGNLIVCTPYPQRIIEDSYEEHSVPNNDLSDIASYYRFLMQNDPETAINGLWSDLKKIDPFFSGIYMSGLDDMKTLTFEFVQKEKHSYSFGELSRGEQMIFELYLLLNTVVKKGNTLLIDEPDNFVSLREIQPWCQELEDAVEDNGGQCFMISHHPEIIDYFGGTSGIWMDRVQGMNSRVIDTPSMPDPALKYSEAISRGVIGDET